jgi:medium-chain acyl-[acyl-carrier-protein] hydrolase
LNQNQRPPQLNILEQDYVIRSYEIDAGGGLSIPSIFNLLQDAASNHAYRLGVAVHQLLEKNYTWVLSRMMLKMDAFPAWRNPVRVRTWPSGIQTVFALRDFEIRNDADRVIGSAVSAWIVIDADKRRPVRPTSFAHKINSVEGLRAFDHPLNKLPKIDAADYESRFFVRYHDLDINQHVNNVRYIEWLLESIPGFGRKGLALKELELNYLGEAFKGDRIISMCRKDNPSGTRFSHIIVREEDQLELIRARTRWDQK